ncbi:MAG: hypothetical protein ICV70_00475 [Jiangellaceae bacterium]|nr:hypothetical protein [Jiangellaceae bacterium]
MSAAAEQVWASIAATELARPHVATGTGFGKTPGLRISGKIYTMFMHGELVLKLPKGRVDELIASGAGKRLDTGRGRLMKEWVVLGPRTMLEWPALVDDARAFVSSQF